MTVEKSRTIGKESNRWVNAVGFDDHFAGSFRILEPKAHVARLFAPGPGRLPQLQQSAHSAFVSRPPGLDALPDPGFFLGQFFVEVSVLLFFGLGFGFLAFQIGGVIACVGDQPAPVQLHDARGDPFQKRPIVGDKKQRIGNRSKTLLFITHDRAFLKKIATRVLELDRGRLISYSCDYETYLARRAALQSAEETRNANFDKALSQEEVWIRQGIKARRTRDEGRVRRLMKMRDAGRARRQAVGNIRFDIQEAERTGKLVIEASDISFSYGDAPVIRDFSTLIMRGDKVGIIGPNGAGKTTLLNILLKNIPPGTGSVRHGTHLQVAYFDQLRAQLDEEKSVRDNILEGNDFILFNGERRHVISHLRDFLFSPERCRTPVHVLSGGEKNRLLLAKLFTQPANVIVLDEPTNDLDAETLELLEERLFEFTGTLLLVSHDRAFLNNVVTSTIVFEGSGVLTEYAGGYDDWLLQRPDPEPSFPPEKTVTRNESPPPGSTKPKKLGYMEVRELDSLPRKIETLESEQKALYAEMADPLFYRKAKDEIALKKTLLEKLEGDIEAAYRRWEALEEKA